MKNKGGPGSIPLSLFRTSSEMTRDFSVEPRVGIGMTVHMRKSLFP